VKIIKKLLIFVLNHPILSGCIFEAILLLLFMLFPAGACNSPIVGVVVVYAHYPALFFTERVIGIYYQSAQLFLAAILMTIVWIGILYLLRRFLASYLKS